MYTLQIIIIAMYKTIKSFISLSSIVHVPSYSYNPG